MLFTASGTYYCYNSSCVSLVWRRVRRCCTCPDRRLGPELALGEVQQTLSPPLPTPSFLVSHPASPGRPLLNDPLPPSRRLEGVVRLPGHRPVHSSYWVAPKTLAQSSSTLGCPAALLLGHEGGNRPPAPGRPAPSASPPPPPPPPPPPRPRPECVALALVEIRGLRPPAGPPRLPRFSLALVCSSCRDLP
jgi:hypothetical protein